MNSELVPPGKHGYKISRRSGAAKNDGVNFEKYLQLLVLFRLLESNQVEEFYIAQNVEEVGAFDDLVIRVTYKPKIRSKIIRKLFLVQLKHKESKTVTTTALADAGPGKGNFKLLKYYEDYKKLLNKIGKFKDPILNSCHLDEMVFVLYTNAECASGNNTFPREDMCTKLLETGQDPKISKVFNFNIPENAKFYEELEAKQNPIYMEEDGMKFLDKLVFFAGQQNAVHLQFALEEKISKYCQDVSIVEGFHTAVNFIDRYNFVWLSSSTGVLQNVEIKFQDLNVELEINKHIPTNSKMLRDIVIQNICRGSEHGKLSIGKKLAKPKPYYVARKLHNGSTKRPHSSNSFNKTSVLLICGGPGVGKSFFFTHLAYELKASNPQHWIIRENFNDYTEYLENLNLDECGKREMAISFLMKMAGVKQKTENNEVNVEYDLFEMYVNEGTIIVLLDGMDEISPTYYDKVLPILKTIKNKLNIQLWISTRAICKKNLERDLSVTAWTLNDFTIIEANKFIEKYCSIPNYQFASTYNLRVPIFCKMIGDIINENGNAEDISGITNEYELYIKFINLMYDIYLKDRVRNTDWTLAARERNEENKSILFRKLSKVALLTIFHDNELKNFHSNVDRFKEKSKSFLTEISTGKEKTGLIINISSDNRPVFVHRTVAEYFAAMWCYENKDIIKELFEKGIFLPPKVQFFLDHMIGFDDQLFKLILTKRYGELAAFLKTESCDVNGLDYFKRNALHYALMVTDSSEALRLVLSRGVKVEADVVKNYTLGKGHINEFYCYAAARWLHNLFTKHTSKYKVFIKFVISANSIILIYLNRLFTKNTKLHTAIIEGDTSDVRSFIQHKVSQNMENSGGFTPMHLAAMKNDETTIRYLNEKKLEYKRSRAQLYPHQCLFGQGLSSSDVFSRNIGYQTFVGYIDELRLRIANKVYDADEYRLHHLVQNLDSVEVKNYLFHSGNVLNRVDEEGRSALHVACALFPKNNADDVILSILITPNVDYKRDAFKLYPHDYILEFESSLVQLLIGFGLKWHLNMLSGEEQEILNLNICDVIKGLAVGQFKRGYNMQQTGVQLGYKIPKSSIQRGYRGIPPGLLKE